MFTIDKAVLERFRLIIIANNITEDNNEDVAVGCSGCSGTCYFACENDCKFDCSGDCGMTCIGGAKGNDGW